MTLWEKLRPKTTSKEEKEQLAATILKQVRAAPSSAPAAHATAARSPGARRPPCHPLLALTPARAPAPAPAQVKGHIVELANNHTASRVIQFCAKSSAEPERKQLMAEVKDNVVALAKSKYGHFLVQKLVNMAAKEELPGARPAGLRAAPAARAVSCLPCLPRPAPCTPASRL